MLNFISILTLFSQINKIYRTLHKNNKNVICGIAYIDRACFVNLYSIVRLLCLDVRKMMLSSISQPVVRPLYNGGRIVLQGAHHYLLNILVDTFSQINTVTYIYFFVHSVQLVQHMQLLTVSKKIGSN